MTAASKSRNRDLIKRILQELAVTGGLTSDEMAERFGIDVKDIRPRITELKLAKKVYHTDQRRTNSRGRNPKVVAIRTPRASALIEAAKAAQEDGA